MNKFLNFDNLLLISAILIFIYIIYNYKKRKHHNKNTNVNLKIKQAETQVKNDIDTAFIKKEDLDLYYKLVKVYHYGLPKKFSMYGIEEEVKPQPIKAIYLYNKLIENNFVPKIVKIECMKNLIDIYSNDIPGYNLKNPEKVKILYKKIYEMSNLDGKYETLLEFIPFLKNGNDGISGGGGNYGNIGNYAEITRLESLKTKIFKELQINSTFKSKRKRDKNSENPLRDFIRADFVAVDDFGIVVENEENEASPVPIIRNDKHNVHDTTLLNSIKSSINKLKEKTEIKISPINTYNQIKDLINSNNSISSEKKSKALKALNEIESKNDIMTFINDTEKNVLNLVWNRIETYDADADDVSKTLKENLIDELSEMIEFDKPVCSTGRITRMIDTINGIDPDVVIKPKWALQKEMVDKANFIFQNYVNSNEKIKKIVDEINPTIEEEQEYQNIKNNIKQEIYSSFEKDYIQTEIMDKETVSYELDKWIDAI